MSQSEHIFLWDKWHRERHSKSSIEIIWMWLCSLHFLVYLDSRYTGWAGGVALMPWPAPFFPSLLSLNMFQDENPILIIQDNMHDILPWIIHWCVVVGASTEGWGPAVPHCSSCGCRNCLGISRETLPVWQHNATLRIYCNIHIRSPAPTWVDTKWKIPLGPFFLSLILLKKCLPFIRYPKIYSSRKC